MCISWQVTFLWNENDFCGVLDKNTYVHLYRATNVAQLNNSTQIDMTLQSCTLSWFQTNLSLFLLLNEVCKQSEEAANTKSIVFDLTRPGLEHTIYCTRPGLEHTIYCTRPLLEHTIYCTRPGFEHTIYCTRPGLEHTIYCTLTISSPMWFWTTRSLLNKSKVILQKLSSMCSTLTKKNTINIEATGKH
jgi:hypothetical protein